MARSFGMRSFAERWAVALALVFGTFNPAGLSYYHWVVDAEAGFALAALRMDAVRAVVGVALLIAYIIYLRATWRSLGKFGLALVAALLGALIWLMADLGLLALNEVKPLTYVFLLSLSVVMAVGVSWSHVRRRITGQIDTDDLSDGDGG